jgi:hypothetical protein
MEWLAEGISLCFLGVLVAVSVYVFGADNAATITYLVATVL